MTFSPLANMKRRIPMMGRFNSREGTPITGVTPHHNAGKNSFWMATDPSYEVSAHYWITDDGEILPQIDESLRAWTSGMDGYPAGRAADMRNITFEISNTQRGADTKSWEVSDAAIDAVIRLIADIHIRYGLGPVKRSATKGLGIHKDWVPTQCPGQYLESKLPYIIREANKIISGAAGGSMGGLTVSEADDIKKYVKEQLDGFERRIKGPSYFGWLKKGQVQIRTMLQGLKSTANERIDPAELAAELAELLPATDAAKVVDELGKRLKK